ncbi:alcohol dehydrogenase catalytic domain-containing protein [Spiractinospora alimapuensis]|uniref:zinc-binding dehydrogenase n=1 Tax=Spiractinospora alimapuensis TaxID=2820884 RepID=UPI001F219643|nr:alcohol dehydrogenase catalytic domain-containing protein [Spiractinospora alimapuensis]QVQ51586.1 alcohol dehydrogenase catalytic domain-containing protein [Spiractinospora alimapuensis]
MVQREHGADGLRWTEVAAPVPAAGEVVVDVSHCGLNHLDLWLKQGGTGDTLSLPRIPGADVTGRVARVGADVTTVRVGDPVVLYPGSSCGACAECAEGVESACPRFQVMGYQFDGGYAQQVLTDHRNAVVLPDGADRRWAGVPVSYVTAWNALVTKSGLTERDTVVIWGATGGLGNAALRIAEGVGAHAIAIVGSENKAAWLRDHGFDGTTIVRSDRVAKDVRAACPGRGASVVLDHVGASTWMSSMKMLAPRGRLAFCGVTSGYEAVTDLRHVFGKQLSIHGSWMGNRHDLAEVVAFLRDRPQALPVIDREFPLVEAAAAQAHMESGDHLAKNLLTIV